MYPLLPSESPFAAQQTAQHAAQTAMDAWGVRCAKRGSTENQLINVVG